VLAPKRPKERAQRHVHRVACMVFRSRSVRNVTAVRAGLSPCADTLAAPCIWKGEFFLLPRFPTTGTTGTMILPPAIVAFRRHLERAIA
jgi:hypothetical protein